ncbi:Sulphatase-modifying factor protein [Acidihalobacter yilgarnensis]|uniref:Sulphatase-modifying factor protein n=1 Tax=Acidihalobacter yilgarnensis TaxID=2819280 RepID=A0A1D8ITC7_9GAMM|nr:Sulphatase-modifying factor protein [Acidihalobacter yilgarnensis]
MHDLEPQSRRDWQVVAAATVGRPVCFADELADGGAGPELIVIPPGSFEMGSPQTEPGRGPEEGPVRYLRLRRAYALGRCAVTADDFARYARASGWRPRAELIRTQGRQPMINLRPREVTAYLAWLSTETGEYYRLPTEGEWEYAARAGSRTPFAFGEQVDCRQVCFNPAFPYPPGTRRWHVAGCASAARLRETGSLPANLWGLHEMHGNIWELTASPWSEDHTGAEPDGHAHPPPGSSTRWVTRGGSWFDPAVLARSAARRPRLADELDTNLGFRVLRELA